MPLDFNPMAERGRGKCNPKNRASVPQGQGGMGSDRKAGRGQGRGSGQNAGRGAGRRIGQRRGGQS